MATRLNLPKRFSKCLRDFHQRSLKVAPYRNVKQTGFGPRVCVRACVFVCVRASVNVTKLEKREEFTLD